jgi:Flp pilus assembly protein TadD
MWSRYDVSPAQSVGRMRPQIENTSKRPTRRKGIDLKNRLGHNGPAMRKLPGALLPAGIFLVTCAVFWPALQGDFNWDDDITLVANLRFRGFQASQIRWMFTNTLMGHYIPFTWLTFALDHALGRMDPWGYHLASLLLHAANAVLVYVVARRLLSVALRTAVDTRVGAGLAALLFALHPQRVESVAWISDRATLLCGTFYLLAVLSYLRGVGMPERHGMWWRAASLVAFAAALLSKGMAMSLPITLLILDAYPLQRWRAGWRRVLVEKLPYCALALAGAVVAAWARSQGAEFTDYGSYGIAARIGLFAYSVCFYPLKLVWPADLSPLYEVPSQVSLLDPRFLLPLVALLVVTSVLLALRRRAPGALAAWAHSAAFVAPVSGVLHSGVQMVADRYSYLAQLGFVLLGSYGLVRLLALCRTGQVRRGATIMAEGGIVLVIGALAVSAWSQSYMWRDPETLWRWSVDLDPQCSRCHNNLGVALMHHRRDPQGLSESEEHLRQAVALRPTYALSHLNLGSVALIRGRYVEAEAALRSYMQRQPDAPDGAERLAVLYLVQGRSDEAIPLLRRARGISRSDGARANLATAVELIHDGEALRFLGQALLDQGRADDAILPLARAVELYPSAPSFRFWLAQAYRGAGQVALADGEFAALRRLDPKATTPTAVR